MKNRTNALYFLAIIGVIMVVASLPLSSSQIELKTDGKSIYNRGDFITIKTTLKGEKGNSGFLDVTSVCGEYKSLIFRKSVMFDSDQSITLDTGWRIIENATESKLCKIQANFLDESQETPQFQISKEIIVGLTSNEKRIYPKETLELSINASKKSGKLLSGTATITIVDILNQTIEIVEGVGKVSVPIKENTSPGTKSIKIVILQRDPDGTILNSGSYSDEIIIGSIASSIEVSSESSFSPPKNLSFSFKVLDQANNPMNNQTLIFRIVDPNNNLILVDSTKNEEKRTYEFPPNAARGAWHINVFQASLSKEFTLYVLDHAEIKTLVDSSTTPPSIKVKNIGNVPYNGLVELKLKNASDTIRIPPFNVSLDLLQTVSLPLPKEIIGEFDALNSQDQVVSHISLFPTVAVIGTGAVTADQLKKSYGSMVYISLAIITLILVGYLSVFIAKKKEYSFENKKEHKKSSLYTPLSKPSSNQNVNLASSKNPPVVQQTSQRMTYVAYFRFKPSLTTKQQENLMHYFSKNGLRLNFVSSDEAHTQFFAEKFSKPGCTAIDLAKNILNKTASANVVIRCAIHRSPSDEKFSSLRQVTQTAKRMAFHTTKPIVLSQGVCNEVKNASPSTLFSDAGILPPQSDEERVIKLNALILT